MHSQRVHVMMSSILAFPVLITLALTYVAFRFRKKLMALREAIQRKKLLTFGHFPKVALTPLPPPVLDTRGVTFV